MPAPVETALIVGCGDVGCRLALRLAARGVAVTGIVRSERGAARLARLGIAALIADLDAEPRSPLPPARWLFHFAPPPDSGVTDPRFARVLAALAEAPARLVYLSTSAVYGDCGGAWIDEDAPLTPASARGQRRLDAERQALTWAAARPPCAALILRVPGIYGPGRLPRARLAAGAPVVAAAEAPFTNRIHAEDLAAAAWVVAERGAAGCAYNVSDGQPTTMTDYLLRSAARLGLPAPPQVPLAQALREASPMLRSFLEESKRLSNARLRALGWTPQYPDLDAGLAASLAPDPVSDADAAVPFGASGFTAAPTTTSSGEQEK